MTHFKIEQDEVACIYGKRIVGTRKKELDPRYNGIPIIDFKSQIHTLADNNIRRAAIREFRDYGYHIHGHDHHEMSGRKGFIEPLKGCKTPGRKTKKSPKKGSKHDPIFYVKSLKDYPAVCYFDGEFSDRIRETKIGSNFSIRQP